MTTKQIQCLLVFLGYDTGGIDGIRGSRTTAALQQYQGAFDGLRITGEADAATQRALAHTVANTLENLQIPPEETPGLFWEEIGNFTRREFACKCGRYCDGFPAEPQEGMVRIAQAARTHFGRPATVISGLRCSRHNQAVGGAANSQHMAGEACDLAVSGVSADALLEFLRQQPGVRYAYKINETNVHFDIPKGGT